MRTRMTSRTAAVITISEIFIFFPPLFSRSIALTPDSVLIDMCSDKKKNSACATFAAQAEN